MAGKRRTRKKTKKRSQDFVSFYDEVLAWLMIALSIFIFLSNFGVCGTIGNTISTFFFGIFGSVQYVVPIIIMIFSLLLIANKFSSLAIKKTIFAIILLYMASIVAQMICDFDQSDFAKMFADGSERKTGGGLLGGSLLYLLRTNLGVAGAVIVTLVISMISIILITEHSLINDLKRLFALSQEKGREQKGRRKVKTKSEDKKTEKKETASVSDRKKKASKDSVVPLVLEEPEVEVNIAQDPDLEVEKTEPNQEDPYSIARMKPKRRKKAVKKNIESDQKDTISEALSISEMNTEKDDNYIFPPYHLLKRGASSAKTGKKELMDTAARLQQTLKNFGVNVTITNVSCGPTVTRFELQPEQGVKVSKIVNLTDDIKLNLAAADIRIEAPIPGKAAVGIEVPNQAKQMVFLRDLLDHAEFKKFPSKVGFAVGRDLSGKPVYADIEKMPHLLIAGATGSGKSVCINTIIMSILYKASPKDVKLIMIDPKVVELSVYEGIPHLLIPVVTDPKQAAGALNWAVMEMMDRYNKFAEVHVRNIKSYNQKVDMLAAEGKEGEDFKKMPQIVIIIDELADLMMVASRDVEDAIVRLTQLARAAGIHLIIATQRPSVNVITGLIKANVPSRIAFAVSSGVDSRTIIDMNGAERLLGNGDMLFFPSGYKQPVRMQGGFVSDEEISDVVGFLKDQKVEEDSQQPDIKKVIEASAQKLSGESNDPNGRDEYFYEAASFIIDKDKASIASLQRVFKIGFNRASRLMEQLCEAGVVGEETGTKPRKVIMSREEFERLKEEEM
ncbi:MAG: DNA translocase FtsK 4TM domain-containing protein [Lachnospiraceae bacterium]|nr:DNA translocase FtsK 4TM domain-containing protein [Lachnospiraceae bacterium]